MEREIHESTYKNPMAKMPISPCFCRRARLRLLITGKGRIMIAKSVAMLMAALTNHMANWLRHVAGSFVQNARTGTQAKMDPNTVHVV
jgi:hypothetical protein